MKRLREIGNLLAVYRCAERHACAPIPCSHIPERCIPDLATPWWRGRAVGSVNQSTGVKQAGPTCHHGRTLPPEPRVHRCDHAPPSSAYALPVRGPIAQDPGPPRRRLSAPTEIFGAAFALTVDEPAFCRSQTAPAPSVGHDAAISRSGRNHNPTTLPPRLGKGSSRGAVVQIGHRWRAVFGRAAVDVETPRGALELEPGGRHRLAFVEAQRHDQAGGRVSKRLGMGTGMGMESRESHTREPAPPCSGTTSRVGWATIRAFDRIATVWRTGRRAQVPTRAPWEIACTWRSTWRREGGKRRSCSHRKSRTSGSYGGATEILLVCGLPEVLPSFVWSTAGGSQILYEGIAPGPHLLIFDGPVTKGR